MLVLPGGALGTENLKKDIRVKAIAERLNKKGRFITAICAAPTVLSAIGITAGKRVTSHPSVRSELSKEMISEDRVIIDGNIITSQGPGTAIEFAFKLVEILLGKDKALEVNKGVLAKL
jgi:4-methyl-5(b-hydroxyethyl)-thiazole monophosphate biosynthesis